MISRHAHMMATSGLRATGLMAKMATIGCRAPGYLLLSQAFFGRRPTGDLKADTTSFMRAIGDPTLGITAV
jgi:hypothetical protein